MFSLSIQIHIFMNHLRISYIIYDPILQCIFHKNRGIPLHDCSTVINLSTFNVYIILCNLPLYANFVNNPMMSFIILSPFLYRIQSRIRYAFNCHVSLISFNLWTFPQFFFVFYDTDIFEEYSSLPPFFPFNRWCLSWGLFDVSSWLDSSDAFSAEILQRWCWVLLRVSHLEIHFVYLHLTGYVNLIISSRCSIFFTVQLFYYAINKQYKTMQIPYS